jgi:RimJ/RimL family protein N-acetyltransferase
MTKTIQPLKYDPAWLACIRPMESSDARALARMHATGMGDSLWGKLGEAFLLRIYAALIGDPDFIAFVYVEDEKVAGFIAGTQNGPAMMRRVWKRDFGGLAWAAIRGALKNPRLIWPLAATPFYFMRSDPALENSVVAESYFCYFEPHLRGKRISGLINKVLFDELLSRGCRHVKITTESDNEGAGRQLASWGFEKRGNFRFYGKEMVVYLLDLKNSPRVEPVSRYAL